MIAVLNWCVAHWFVFFLLAIFGVFEGVRDFFVGIAEAVGGLATARHQRKLELARAQHPVPPSTGPATDPPAPGPAPLPGRCVHRRVKQVRDLNDDLVGWLCTTCDTQLPADWAIAKEDLP